MNKQNEINTRWVYLVSSIDTCDLTRNKLRRKEILLLEEQLWFPFIGCDESPYV